MAKANRTVWLCFDPVRLNWVLIRPVYTGPNTNNMYSRMICVHYLTPIDARQGYYNLKLDKCICPFGRSTYTRLLFTVAQAGDMFKQNINDIFKDIPLILGFMGDILIV